ncbi:MAG: hypothetical protein CMB80_26910 [Flammeovirgaceae bacterium]|nr:hypothetical protein [Flammeovirgaceae bacterium]MBR09641.1 hypothetical protein [Rickettsiales bacterium]HCX22768.1 hypothetical protein [Cytophagales bacterium]|tara:strand:+ start:8 stop:271 length:264 start_codon:yes stop_codon:yes gene_type:complete
MKKALPHILYILVILFLGVLSQINSKEAEKQEMIATSSAEKAEEAVEEAMKSAAMAKKAENLALNEAKKAQEARLEAERLLKECKGK